MKQPNTIPTRAEVNPSDTWNLGSLYESDMLWEKDLKLFTGMIPSLENFKGTLGSTVTGFAEFLALLKKAGLISEKLGYYAFLKYSEDAGDSKNQARYGKIMQAETQFNAAISFFEPEIQSIPKETITEFLQNPAVADYKIMLHKILRYKPHILSEKEERLLALQAEYTQTPQKAFSALTDVDMNFGVIATENGEKPLSQATFSSFLLSQKREIRQQAFQAFYKAFEAHKNTLAALYIGSVQQDIYRAKIRSFPSARAASLFSDDVPESVYDTLIETIHAGLPVLHDYYSMRKKLLGVEELRHYDVYVPLVKDIEVHHSYDEAVNVVVEALAPLGKEYTTILQEGLTGGWVDKYENKGKRSGAFSAGSFSGDPYILMNYKEDVLRDVFTLAHEGGHSMHSWYSSKNNPFQHYNYTIFEAEVASTCNERLLAAHLLEKAVDTNMKAYIIGKQIDDIIATIFRQTMFAEFEMKIHAFAEAGTPLTLELLRSTYRELLTLYFGPDMHFEETSDLEGLRIPHFYRSFYVYKYATGLSAAIALAGKILQGGDKEREQYLSFLKSGGSKFPLESLGTAGVDMSSPEPVEMAIQTCKDLIQEFKRLMKIEE